MQQQFLGGLGPIHCPRATGQSLTPVGDLQTLHRRDVRVLPLADQDISLPTVLHALKTEREQYCPLWVMRPRTLALRPGPSTSSMRCLGVESLPEDRTKTEAGEDEKGNRPEQTGGHGSQSV